MQTRRLPISTTLFLAAIALLISSLFVSLPTFSLGMAIGFVILALCLSIIAPFLFKNRPICSKWSIMMILLFFSASLLLIIFASISLMASQKDFLGRFSHDSANPFSLALFTITPILLAAAIFIILLFLSFRSALPASIYFCPLRFFFLLLFRLIGRAYRWLSSGWRSHAIMLADAAIICYIAYYVREVSLGVSPLIAPLFNASTKIGFLPPWSLFGVSPFNALIVSMYVTIWLHWEQILVIWFLFEVGGILSRASNQLSIDEVDFSADSEQKGKKDTKSAKSDSKSETNGIADLLAVNINRISELYRTVDEQRAIKSESGAGRPIEATLKSGDMSEILENSASEGSQISLGPISVPIGSITGLAGRLMQGPRISVSLHKYRDENDKDYLYLTATMSGKEPCSWVIKEQMPLEGESNTRNIDDMVAELAHRIFAKLAFGDQGNLIPWRAVWNFNEGLRAYRDCLHSIKKRQYFLNHAEKHFIETVEDDDDFIQAYYNLGVVYTELNQFDSAEAAFSKAIEKKPDKWEPYYALGINLYNRARDQEDLSKAFHNGLPESCKHIIIEQYERVINLCKYIINILERKGRLLNKDYDALAKAYNLIGNAQKNLSMIDCRNWRPSFGDDDIDSGIFDNNQRAIFNESIKSCESAVNYAWCNLISAELWGDGVDNANRTVSECLIDLADVYLYNKSAFDASKSLEQAISLQSSDPHLYLGLGMTYCSQEKIDAAKKVFEFGVQMAPEDQRFWACLGNVQAEKGNMDKAGESWEKVILYGPGVCSDALYYLSKAYNKPGGNKSDEIIRLNHAMLLVRLNEDGKKGDSIIYCLEKLIKCEALISGEEWKHAVSSIRLLDLYDDIEAWDNRQTEKEELFENYINKIIKNLKNTKDTKNGYEEAHNRYALGYLLVLYYHYRLELCLNAEKAFEAGKAAYINHNIDEARKQIRKSIKLLENNPFLYKNNGNRDLNEKKINMHIEKAREHLEIKDLKVPVTDLDKIFGIIYNEYKNEAEDCMVSAKEIFNNELQTKGLSPGFNSHLKEYINFLVESGQLYLKFGEYEKAEEHFRQAIEKLEIYPQEIKRRGLYSLLSRSIRLQNKDRSRALKMAQRAKILYPLGYEERKELGTTFCDLDEFDFGLEELDNALSWKPDNPDILFDLGRYYLKRALMCSDKNLRRKTLQNAMDNLKQSLKILENYQVEKRGRVRYWLGRAHSELKEYRRAIPHFRILYNVRLGKEEDNRWLIAAMQLGNAYLKIKSYNESDELFDLIIKRFEFYDEKVTDDIVGKRLDDRFTKREIFINACLGKSYSCIDRSGDPNEAMRYAILAGKYANPTKSINHSKASKDDRKFIEERIRLCQASYEACIGWILYNREYVNEAIAYLEMSVSKWADSLTYLHLASAFESKMESCDSKSAEKMFLARRARECCQLASEFDVKEEYEKELSDMKQRLSGKKIETSAKEGNMDGLPESIGSKERCGQD
jgi:tetratricopeptide (TPR) repeat protein